uniref:Uncharacterized protein n=1 Tax=Leersia perrieri TaxID=77586 RepID=A0A0D9VX54_9ORYZ
MERSSHHAILLGLLAFAAAAATDVYPEPQFPCEAHSLANQVQLHCGGAPPSELCCAAVVVTVETYGGVPCVCRVAASPKLRYSGLDDAAYLLELYAACGGDRLTATCKGEKEPAPAPSGARLLHTGVTRRHLGQQHAGGGIEDEDIPADAALLATPSLE